MVKLWNQTHSVMVYNCLYYLCCFLYFVGFTRHMFHMVFSACMHALYCVIANLYYTISMFIYTQQLTSVTISCQLLIAQSLGTDVWCACLIFCLPSYIHVYKRSYPSPRCTCGGRAERPQMVYMNDNTSLIHQIKFRHNLNPCAHPRWLVECAISIDRWSVVLDQSPWLEMLKNAIGSGVLVR